jgi:hypothetical protein
MIKKVAVIYVFEDDVVVIFGRQKQARIGGPPFENRVNRWFALLQTNIARQRSSDAKPNVHDVSNCPGRHTTVTLHSR